MRRVLIVAIVVAATAFSTRADEPVKKPSVPERKFTAAILKATDAYWTAIVTADQALVSDLSDAAKNAKGDALKSAQATIDAAKAKLDIDLNSQKNHDPLPSSDMPEAPFAGQLKPFKSIDEIVAAIPQPPKGGNQFTIDVYQAKLKSEFIGREFNGKVTFSSTQKIGAAAYCEFKKGGVIVRIFIDKPTDKDAKIFASAGTSPIDLNLVGKISGIGDSAFATYATFVEGQVAVSVECTTK